MKKLRDMIRKKKSKSEIDKAMPFSHDEEEKYPYGLQVRLEKEDLDKLNIDIKKLGIDEKVSITAIAEITGINLSKSRTGERQGLSLQITKMDIKKRISLKNIKRKT